MFRFCISFRYEKYWIPFILSNSPHYETDVTFLPPLDVHWVWHVHMLAPMNYHQDLSESPLRRIINHQPINPQSKEAIGKRKQTAIKWIETFPEIPFELSLTDENSFDDEFSSKLTYNIVAASERQKVFFYQVK